MKQNKYGGYADCKVDKRVYGQVYRLHSEKEKEEINRWMLARAEAKDWR